MEEENGLTYKFDTSNHTASVVQSRKASGNIFIPQSVNYKGNNYKIISIDTDAFLNNDIESLMFDENSEVSIFETHSFLSTKIKKLQIPPKLKKLQSLWCQQILNLTEIEISPKNKNFMYIDNKYLVGKSDEKSDKFDILYYARFDIEEAVIPSQIKFLMEYSFYAHEKLKSIIFGRNSELRKIDLKAFSSSPIKKLALPEKVDEIRSNCFNEVPNLVDLSISPKNQNFKYIENKYLVKKMSDTSKFFDVIIFARRDIDSIKIPANIKRIGEYAFQNCNKLKSIKFESKSSLEKIESCAFSQIYGQSQIVLPSSVKMIDSFSFSQAENVESIEFLGDSIEIPGYDCFSDCEKLKSISFPNAKKIEFDWKVSMNGIPKKTKIRVRKDAELICEDIESFKDRIEYFTGKIEKRVQKDEKDDNSDDDNDTNDNKKIEFFVNHIRSLEDRLRKYEKVERLDMKNTKNKDKNDFATNIIDSSEETNYTIIEKIGEGSTSNVYKIMDKRTKKILCKKELKTETTKETPFKKIKDVIKEFEVLQKIDFPSICRAYSINLQDKIVPNKKPKDDDDDDEDEYSTKNKKKEGTNKTISMYIEYIPYKLKDLIENELLNNTLKTRIAVEVAFGMFHIHSLGMIHRDLKIENIMVNYVYESKIIDFDLVQFQDNLSLSKGVGTLAYMSPEMQNEEDYDLKTDVYSYGVVLFVLFTGHLPKQSMKDKLTNKPLRFPHPSSSISAFCISLIKKCMSFDPNKRPSFEEILFELKSNSFLLADEVDTELVYQRYQLLNQY